MYEMIGEKVEGKAYKRMEGVRQHSMRLGGGAMLRDWVGYVILRGMDRRLHIGRGLCGGTLLGEN